jgi:hypothetical protein
MTATIADIAEAFSHHSFDRTFEYMGDDIEWTQVGQGTVRGKIAVVTTCKETTDELVGVRTTFSQFKVVAAENCVVIDSRAEYEDAEGASSHVASCDIYDFISGDLVAITSYAVEIGDSAAD